MSMGWYFCSTFNTSDQHATGAIFWNAVARHSFGYARETLWSPRADCTPLLTMEALQVDVQTIRYWTLLEYTHRIQSGDAHRTPEGATGTAKLKEPD
jgi:hypothetical protein